MDEKIIIDVPAPLLVTSSMDDKKKMKKKAWFKWAPFQLLSVEEVFKWAPFQLPVNSFKKNKPRMPLLSVQEVLGWALLAAGCVAATVVITAAVVSVVEFANLPIPCSESPSWWMVQCPTLTPAQDVEVESFGEGYLWFTLPQAAAAAVGLLLPRRLAKIRWYLAFFAIVSAAAAHYMQCRTVLVFIAANPEDIFFRILGGGGAVFFVAGDLISILSLLIGGTE
ncbi:hypothetical protein EJB05_24911 [Eragrostis curvula]|uniref:Uncharacterized protein n=1 Tax=Eragrostis curvula TaxID=38414 RepID=A0A5J9VB01_9POAL|nr:hypothetical protein EJB05_24911 [Eragrostis curvula]